MRKTGVRRFVLLLALLAASGGVLAQIRATLTPYGPTEVMWGDPRLIMRGDVFYSGPPCPGTASLPPMEGTMSLFASGTLIDTRNFFTAFGRSCSNGAWTAQADLFNARNLPFGTYVLIGRYNGSSSLPPVATDPLIVRISPQFSWIVPWNQGVLKAGMSSIDTNDNIHCYVRDASYNDRTTLPVPLPPPNMRYPYEHVTFGAANCQSSNFGAMGPATQSILLEFPDDIPAGSELWVHETTRDRPNPVWKRLAAATLEGRRASAVLQGASVTVFDYDSFIGATVALAVPQPDSKGGALQDLWWSGTSEAGWGLNIAKIEQRIFATLFIYDDAGKPQWVVMPSGTWDPVHQVYYGDLFIPSGTTSYANYDPYYFQMGAAVGTGSLSFTADDDGNFDYVINGQAGGKRIGRYKFARVAADGAAPYAGMWWGGPTQDGWGLSIQQQGQTLFTTWYTYGPDGKVTWFYMPGGTWTSPTRYSGPLYRTTGSRWAGANYDASKLKVIPVGTMSLDFTSPNAATMTSVVDGVTITRAISRFLF